VKIVNTMKRALKISVIVSVAVVMGLSTIAPMIQYVDASHGPTDIPDAACGALLKIPNPPPKIVQIIIDHCAPGSGS